MKGKQEEKNDSVPQWISVFPHHLFIFRTFLDKYCQLVLLLCSIGDHVIQGCGITMPKLSNLSHFPEDKLKISIYLSWDKDCITLAKECIQIMKYIFFLFFEGNICCGYSLEVPHRGTSNALLMRYTTYVFCEK